jgi:hypothetical protein
MNDTEKQKLINALKESITIQMDIEFIFEGKPYYLGPIYGNDKSLAVAWLLSTDNGETAKTINSTDPDEVLRATLTDKPLIDCLNDIEFLYY